MELKKVQLLRNPDIEPTREVISEALANSSENYWAFIDELKKADIRLNWRYYSDGKAWLGKGLYEWTGTRGGRHEMTVFWLSIWEGFFKVTFYIPEKNREALLDLPLEESIREKILNSAQIGQLKFFSLVFEVHARELLHQVLSVADFKRNK